MKLQYLGDYRDAFKWDLLHWVCTEANPAFGQLVFVPLLTPDDPIPSDGQIPHRRFAAREFVHTFLETLRHTPRRLDRVATLGAQIGEKAFEVSIHAPDLHIGPKEARLEYWRELRTSTVENSVVFVDPDNGFETKTRHGTKWVLHAEVEHLLQALRASNGIVVYQHRPQRQAWDKVLGHLRERLTYAPFACAAYDQTLALVAVARSESVYERLRIALTAYVAQHGKVKYLELRRAGA